MKHVLAVLIAAGSAALTVMTRLFGAFQFVVMTSVSPATEASERASRSLTIV